MRAGTKLVLTILAAFVLHGIFYYLAADSSSESFASDPLISSLFLNLVGIPIGIYLGKTDVREGAGFLGYGRLSVTVVFFWVFIFGFLAALGLLIGKYIADMIRESGDIPPASHSLKPSLSSLLFSPYRLNR